MGFGVTLTYPDFSPSVTAAQPLHPIFLGPYGVVPTSYTGNFFGHGTVSGGGITSIIDQTGGASVLAEKSYGAGHLLVGGMTTDNFHQPQPDAHILLENILAYGASQAGAVAAVPEPATIASVGFGILAGVGALIRRRRVVA